MYSVGAASTPVPATHRWNTKPRWQERRKVHAFDPVQRAWLRELRWRQEALSVRWVALLLVASLFLHGLAFWGLRIGTQPVLSVPSEAQRDVIEVRLIETSAIATPSPPPPQVLPDLQVRRVQGAPPVRRRSSMKAQQSSAMQATLEEAPKAQLFDARGEVIVPTSAASVTTPAYRAGILETRDAQRPQQPQSPIKYKPTVFEQDWVPEGESALESVVRKTVVSGTVLKLPGGYRLKCGIAPLMLAGGCGIDDPDQLSRPLKVKHERDNLPTATPLIRPKAEPAEATSVAPTSSIPVPATSVVAPLPAATTGD